jgi:hypothetical protein
VIPAVSVVCAVLATAATRAALSRCMAAPGGHHVPWAIGLTSLLPAWLVAFVPLLSPLESREPLRIALWVLSGWSALGGAILTESLVRMGVETSERSPVRAWRLGTLALAPAWLIALIAHLVQPAK